MPWKAEERSDMYNTAKELIESATKIIVIQAENPDGDSLGSALALEEILGDLGKKVILYCPVDIPKYLRYVQGWDRITSEFDASADLAIIVDTSADILLSKVLEVPGARHYLETHPALIIDHHTTPSTLSFDYTPLIDEAVASSEIIYNLANKADWKINKQAAEQILIGMLSDTLGMTTQNVSSQTYAIASKLIDLGAHTATIEERRREFMKKSPEILKYKGELLGRLEYFLDGRLSLIHIPWEDIQRYSDQYNPSVLVLDEMRLVENVVVGIAIKTYPDGKLTGKIKANIPIAEKIAGYFGGGGHPYAAGFRVYEDLDKIKGEILEATDKVLGEYDSEAV